MVLAHYLMKATICSSITGESMTSISRCLFWTSFVAVAATPWASAAPIAIDGITYVASSVGETLNAPFKSISGAETQNPYSNYVLLTVSGTGTSFSSELNDAFYTFDGSGEEVTRTVDLAYYQLRYSNA